MMEGPVVVITAVSSILSVGSFTSSDPSIMSAGPSVISTGSTKVMELEGTIRGRRR